VFVFQQTFMRLYQVQALHFNIVSVLETRIFWECTK